MYRLFFFFFLAVYRLLSRTLSCRALSPVAHSLLSPILCCALSSYRVPSFFFFLVVYRLLSRTLSCRVLSPVAYSLLSCTLSCRALSLVAYSLLRTFKLFYLTFSLHHLSFFYALTLITMPPGNSTGRRGPGRPPKRPRTDVEEEHMRAIEIDDPAYFQEDDEEPEPPHLMLQNNTRT